MRNAPVLFGWLAVVALAWPAWGQEVSQQASGTQTPRASTDVERLQAQLADQQAAIAALRRELEAERQERAAEVERALSTAQAAARDARGVGLVPPVVSARGFSLALSGFVQVDDVLYNQASQDQLNDSTGQPLNQTRFLVRRAHLRTDVGYGIVSGALELEASTVNDPIVRVFGAEMSVRWPAREPGAVPYLVGTLGLYRIPFGFENQQKDYDRLFLERAAVIRAAFPGENDLGGGIWGGWRIFRYQLAAMNGDPIGELQLPARDPNAAKDLLGRVGVDTGSSHAVDVRAGVSGLSGTGFHRGTPATKDVLVWRDTNQDGIVQLPEIQVIPGQPATPSQNFNRFGLGADAQVLVNVPRLGELMLYGELLWATNLDRSIQPADPVAAGRDLREFGWYLGFTQELTRHALVGVRYDRYNPDADAQDRQGLNLVPMDPTLSTLAIAAAWRYGAILRVTVEYDHNTNALGRTLGGLPTTLASDVLTLRGQVVF